MIIIRKVTSKATGMVTKNGGNHQDISLLSEKLLLYFAVRSCGEDRHRTAVERKNRRDELPNFLATFNKTSIIMIRSGFDGERPLYTLTVGEFIELLDQRLGEIIKNGQSQQENPAGTSHVVYGLRGIQQLFGCSHKTAQYYKDHVIQEAVFQNGRKIVVDAELALQLFNNRGTKTKSQTFLMFSYRKEAMPAQHACSWPYFTGMPSSRM